MKQILRGVVVLVIVSLLMIKVSQAQQYPGTTISGQVLVLNSYGQQVPLAYARVDLLFFDARYAPGLQWRLVATASTDGYGFYSFKYVIPNNYSISVNQTKSMNISVGYIDYRYYSFQSLPPFFF